MPGVGVAPGFRGLLSVLGSGIPGVGVAPFGNTFMALAGGMPGVEFVEGGIGEVLNPSGKFCGTVLAELLTAALLFVGVDWHPNAAEISKTTNTIEILININAGPQDLK